MGVPDFQRKAYLVTTWWLATEAVSRNWLTGNQTNLYNFCNDYTTNPPEIQHGFAGNSHEFDSFPSIKPPFSQRDLPEIAMFCVQRRETQHPYGRLTLGGSGKPKVDYPKEVCQSRGSQWSQWSQDGERWKIPVHSRRMSIFFRILRKVGVLELNLGTIEASDYQMITISGVPPEWIWVHQGSSGVDMGWHYRRIGGPGHESGRLFVSIHGWFLG